MKKRRSKYQRKQDLAHIKAQWALFQQISADTKDLDDIPRYWPQAKGSACPWSSTPLATFAVACCSGPSPKNAALRPAPSSPRASSSIWIATASRCAIWSGKPTTVASSKAISPKLSATASTCASRPPLTPTRAMSKPFIASKKTSSSIWKTSPAAAISSPRSHTYQLYFNLVGPNSHKENLSPWQIIERLAPRSPLELCLLPPVFLDYYLNDQGGYDVPRLPYWCSRLKPTLLQHRN
jgi:hypothetical protein